MASRTMVSWFWSSWKLELKKNCVHISHKQQVLLTGEFSEPLIPGHPPPFCYANIYMRTTSPLASRTYSDHCNVDKNLNFGISLLAIDVIEFSL